MHEDEDALTRLWWAIRRYAVPMVLVVAASALALALLLPSDPADEYRASALVVANNVDGISAEHLPRMAEAVFTGQYVPREAVESGGLPFTPEEFVEDHAEIETFDGTVVIRVNGRADDPELSARIANAGATALVTQLNEIGPDIAQFSVLESAQAPGDPAEEGLRIPMPLLGLLLGLVLAGGLLMLLLAVRRPVMNPRQAQTLTQVPLLGSLRVSRAGSLDAPADAEGIVGLSDRLFPQGHEATTVLTADGASLRSQVSLLLARTLASVGPVCLIPANDVHGRRIRRVAESDDRIHTFEDVQRERRAMPIVVDGAGGLPMELTRCARSILFVSEGISRRGLDEHVQRFQTGEISGLVWVRRRGRTSSLLRRVSGGGSEVDQRSLATADVSFRSREPIVRARARGPVAPRTTEPGR